MLTIHQIIGLAENIDIEIINKRSPHFVFGVYEPDNFLVKIFLPDIKDRENFNLTLVHELIHARDDVLANRSLIEGENDYEKSVEDEAKKTYAKHPEYIKFIRELFHIKDRMVA